MFKKAAFIATGALALAALASPAFAQSFNPSSGTFTGASAPTVTLRQSTTVACNVALTANVTSATTATIPTRSISPGSLLCLAVVPYGTWSAATVPGDSTKIALTMGANTVANEPCYGTVIVPFSGSTLTFSGQTLPPVNPAHRTCYLLAGAVTITGLTIVP